MKKLFTAMVMLFSSLTVLAQNGANEILISPNTNTPYFLVDTVFTLGTGADDTTTIYLHYHNPTSQIIQGFQVRFFYDNVNFSTPIVKWGPTATSVTTKYGSFYTSSNWVNATAVYTGPSNTFDWPDGAVFKVVLPHSASYDPAAVDSIKVVGTPVYPNLATTQSGIDITLGTFSYNGQFIQPSFNYPVRAWNVGGLGADSVEVTYSYKKKASPTYLSSNITFYTDTTGLASVVVPYDTNYYNVKVELNSAGMDDDGAINITDAYKILAHSILADTLETYGFQQGDVNLSNSITVSDGFLVFNRIATSQTTWANMVSGENNVKLLTDTEYQSILASPTSFQTSIDGDYTKEVVINSLDSSIYHVFVLGDATNTGVNNQMVQIALKVDPGQPSDWVLDQAVLYRTIEDTVEFRVPKITPANNQEFDVPVSIYTHGNKIGAAQVGLEFDTTLFEFLGVQTSDIVGQWNSFISVKNGKVLWGGHENHMAPGVIESNLDVITFKFRIINQDWTKSNIRVVSKGAGSEKAEDLNIKPTPTDGTIFYVGKTEMDPIMQEMVQGFLVYPNPVDYGYNLIDFYTWEDTRFTMVLMGIDGTVKRIQTEEVKGENFYTYYVDFSDLPVGVYIMKMYTNSKEKFVRVIKRQN
jgi:hypothetical protein